MNEFRHLFRSAHLNLYEVHCSHGVQAVRQRVQAIEPTIALHRSGFCLVRDGDEEHAIDANRACFMNAGQDLSLDHPIGGGCVGTMMTLTPELLAHGFRAYGVEVAPADAHFPCVAATIGSDVDLLHRKLVRELAHGMNPEDARPAVFAFFSGLMDLVIRSRRTRPPDRTASWRGQARLVNEVRARLSQQLAARPSLNALAESLGCSPFHLSRIFHRHAGLSLTTYFQKLRLRAALERILDDVDNITTIASELGFTHQSHLTNSFRREYGVPPSVSRIHQTAPELAALVVPED